MKNTNIGTLGPNLTCSFLVAKKKWYKKRKILCYASFEDAADDVKLEKISAFLVPVAYPGLRYFLMDAQLQVKEIFIKKIPPLILAGKTPNTPRRVNILFYHPATEPLVLETGIDFEKRETVLSNFQACIAVKDSSNNTVAITNGPSAKFFKLYTYKILRHTVSMPFIVFRKTKWFKKDNKNKEISYESYSNYY